MHHTTPPAARVRGLALLFALVLGLAGAFAACSSGEGTLDAVDPEAVTATPTYDQVFAIIQNHCVSCHDGSDDGGEDDLFADESAYLLEDVPGLETCTSIVALRSDILDQVEANTMPPGAMPRLTSEQKLTIRRWVENGAPAPCN